MSQNTREIAPSEAAPDSQSRAPAVDPSPDAERVAEPSAETAPSGRDRAGRFTAGNTASLRHGLRSQRALDGRLPEQADAAAALREREAALVADLGGADAISAVAFGLVRRHVRLELAAELVWANLQACGVLSAKGRARAALNAWLLIVDRLHRSAMALGLQRRPGRVPGPREWLESLAAEPEEGHDDGD